MCMQPKIKIHHGNTKKSARNNTAELIFGILLVLSIIVIVLFPVFIPDAPDVMPNQMWSYTDDADTLHCRIITIVDDRVIFSPIVSAHGTSLHTLPINQFVKMFKLEEK